MTAVNVGYLKRRPKSEPVRFTKCRRLTDRYSFQCKRTGRKIVIPAGFHWDGTSIPRILWSVMGGPFNPKYEIAGLVHDYLYRSSIHDDLNRKETDLIFYDILRLEHVGLIRSHDMYYGVRLGGWTSYNKKELFWKPEGAA